MERSEGKIKAKSGTNKGWFVHLIDKDGYNILVGCSQPEAKTNAAHLVECWNAFEEGGLVGELVGALKDALKDMESDAVQCNGEWQQGLFCGLEDVGTTDRYEACMHGYEAALSKVQEWVLCNFEAVLARAKAEGVGNE